METQTVKELMMPLSEYALVPRSATLKEALRIMRETRKRLVGERHGPRAVLVVDDQKRVVGQLGHLDILRALEPKYSHMGDLDLLSRAGVSDQLVRSLMDNMKLWESTLDDACRRAAAQPVAHLMQPIAESIAADASVSEAIHKVLLSQSMRLLVTENDQVVGVLRLADLVADVARRIETAE